ncbi:hypothetical protein BTM25_26880 [Actinomadura rubteroloni]|uniref:Uncharacterized protein n=1 Tax=Actinomadura rubteroloni TaxID=1926885 RepID=A0A2P4UG80_9ACTN|nr:hypothetical protein [Actinomadura rubteroloni]POM24061.1 hypothetical protein BTM25_26880 [Actinomadura rubteroloni]
MADDWVERTADDLRRWTDEHDEPVDVQGVRLLLDLAREEIGLTGPDALDPAALRRLLLEAFPAAVVAEAAEVPAILTAVGHLVAYLGARGHADGAALTAALAEIAPRFARAVADAETDERRAAAEIMTALMRADGVDPADQAAADGWVAAFEALPERERYARVDAHLREHGDDLVVPPVRLPSRDELAVAAAESGLTRQTLALAAWAVNRRLTAGAEPSAREAQAAVDEIGLAIPRRAATVAALSDLPELHRLWWAAVRADILDTSGGVGAPGPAQAALAGDDVLTAWLGLFEHAVAAADAPAGQDAAGLVRAELPGVLLYLYEQGGPVPHTAIAAALAEHVAETYAITDGAVVTEALTLELADLAAWGVAVRAGDGWTLTPLGLWGVREMLLADGYTAPLDGEASPAL